MISKRVLEKHLKEYNKYIAGAIRISLLDIDKNGIYVRFSGKLCSAYNFYEYLDGLRLELESLIDQNIKIMTIKNRDEYNLSVLFTVGTYVD